MSKTRIQSNQRPAAKGKHQRGGQRPVKRENPPAGLPWGQKNWTGTGGGVAQPFGLLLWESQVVVSPSSGAMRVNNANPALATTVWLNETYQPGSIGDPIGTLIVGDPLRIYNVADETQWLDYAITAVADSGAYRTYTATFVANHGGMVPTAGMLVGIAERAATSPAAYEPFDHTIVEVQDYVLALAMDDQRTAIIQAILDLERAGKHRTTLETWLDGQLGVV